MCRLPPHIMAWSILSIACSGTVRSHSRLCEKICRTLYEQCLHGLMVANAGRAHEQGEALSAPRGILSWHELAPPAGRGCLGIHRLAAGSVGHLL